jgi:hypothetical protein
VNWVASDGELFCMVTRDAGNLPHGVVIDGCGDFRGLGLTVDTPVNVSPAVIRFGVDGLSVDLSGARSWSPFVASATGVKWHRTCAAAAIETLVNPASAEGAAPLFGWIGELAKSRPLSINGGPIEGRLASAIRDLCRAIRCRDSDAFVAAAAGIVGTGVGLTPSGDDVLLGTLSVLMTRFDPAAPGGWLGRCVRSLSAVIEGRTTRVSEAFLGHALNARFPERLADLLDAFATDDPHAVEDAARRLKHFGKTSGREMGLGALLADASLAAAHADAC